MNRKIPRLGLASTLRTLGLLFAMSVAFPVGAQQAYYDSMLIDGPGYIPNVIYARHAAIGIALPFSWRLHDFLETKLGPGHSARVCSLSFGLDGTDYRVPHGLLLFSLANSTSNQNGSIFGSSSFQEPPSEQQSDLFGVQHTPSATLDFNLKIADEFGSTAPPLSDQYLNGPSLGLVPWDIGPRPDLIGYSYQVFHNSSTLYFTFEESTTIDGVTYSSADILALNPANQLSVWAYHFDMLLDPLDRINALSMCVTPAHELGQEENCLVSLHTSSPTVASGHPTAGPASSADIFHYIKPGSHPNVTVPTTPDPVGFRLWRSAISLGLIPATSASGPVVIDEITSIDPRTMPQGDPYGTTPALIDTDVTSSGVVIYSQFPSSTVPPDGVILFDFDLTPLDATGQFDPGLTEGQEKEIRLHYYDPVTGEPKSHLEVVSSPTSTAHAARSFYAENSEDRVRGKIVGVDSSTPILHWRVETSEGIFDFPPTVDEFLLPPLSPGLQTIELATVSASGVSQRLRAHVEVPSSLDSPEDLSITELEDGRLHITWSNSSVALETRVEIVGGTTEIKRRVVGSFLTPPLPPGFHRIVVTHLGDADVSSAPVTEYRFVQVPRRLVPWYSVPLAGTSGSPVRGLTYVDRLGSVLAVDGSDWVTLYDVSAQTAASVQILGQFPLFGVCQHFESAVGGGDGPEELLLWTSEHSGAFGILVTEAASPFIPLSFATIDFPPGEIPASIGDLDVDPDSGHLLVSADQRLYRLEPTTSFQLLNTIEATPVNTLGQHRVTTVAVRAPGYYATAGRNSLGQTTDLTIFDLDQSVAVDVLELPTPISATAVTFGRTPRLTAYIATSTSIELYRAPDDMPLRGGTPRAVLYDLNGDGLLNLDDYLLLIHLADLFANDPDRATLEWSQLSNYATWDVHGGDVVVAGDGVVDGNDLTAIILAYAGTPDPTAALPTGYCVRVLGNETWAPDHMQAAGCP